MDKLHVELFPDRSHEINLEQNWQRQLIDDDGIEKEVMRQNPKPFRQDKSFVKLVRTGPITEVNIFQKPIFTKAKGSPKLSWRTGRKKDKDKVMDYERREEVRSRTMMMSKTKIQRLSRANFAKEHSKFITLTFSDFPSVTDRNGIKYDFKNHCEYVTIPKTIKYIDSNGKIRTKTTSSKEVFNNKNVTHTNAVFKTFIKDMRKIYNDFKYLAVIEFQDETRDGVVHYHVLADLPYIENKRLSEDLWGWGYVLITDIRHVDNLADYISKYMTKDLSDFRLEGKKAYLPSKNLIMPETTYSEEAHKMIYEIDHKVPIKENEYGHEDSFCGRVQYLMYHDDVTTKADIIARKKRLERNHKTKNAASLGREHDIAEKKEYN